MLARIKSVCYCKSPMLRQFESRLLCGFLVLTLLALQAIPLATRHYCDYLGWHEHWSADHSHDHSDHQDESEESESDDCQVVVKLASHLIPSLQLVPYDAIVFDSDTFEPGARVIQPVVLGHLANAPPYPHLILLNHIRLLI